MADDDVIRKRLKAKSRKRFLQKTRYGTTHIKTKQFFRGVVAAGVAVCARCHLPIAPDEPWDLGHSDANPRVHTGPEHRSCNRGAPHRNVTSRVW